MDQKPFEGSFRTPVCPVRPAVLVEVLQDSDPSAMIQLSTVIVGGRGGSIQDNPSTALLALSGLLQGARSHRNPKNSGSRALRLHADMPVRLL